MIQKKSNFPAQAFFLFNRNQKLRIGMVFTLLIGLSNAACSSTLDDINPNSAPAVYYLNPEASTISPDGKIKSPFTHLDEINNLKINPGDSILLANGTTSKGTLILKNIKGTENKPVTISGYNPEGKTQTVLPVIDAKGFDNGILLQNCSHIQITGLEIRADGGGIQFPGAGEPEMRCGILVQTSQPGNYENIILSGLTVKDIFFEEPGFKRGEDEVRTANGTQRYGWGIRFINNTEGALLKDLKVLECEIGNIAHTGLKFTAKNHGIEDIHVSGNEVTNTGGPGIQMSGVKNGMVDGNYVDSSGSTSDSRKWGRGSGLWTWGTANVVIQNNYFLNANGPGDSVGCHIDFNCNDVVVQYNFSANNAGGFCEILGNNHNCAYRYNISVNDGWRVKGQDGAFQGGKIFWLSGFVGSNQKPKGPFNSYFYNNTIYTKSEIAANFAVAKTSEGVLIANNIFCIEGESKLVAGDQYMPESIGSTPIKNYVFENNLYLTESNWPKEVLFQDRKPLIGNPQFKNKGGQKKEDYIPLNTNSIKNKGIKIPKIPGDDVGLKIGLEVKHDILGNKITGKPDLGAIEIID
jgi:hypothetical protein